MQALDELQRRLWRLISAPEGVAKALVSEPEAGSLSDWIVANAQLDAAHRLEVYANAYFARIHECLAGDFGSLQAAMGEAGFHDLVTAYLIAHPSRHPSLRFIGAALPDYLGDAPQAAPFRRRWPWAADLARLEWSLGCAFDAADATPLGREELARAAGDGWDDLVLIFHASVASITTDWPVHELYDAWLTDATLHAPAEAAVARICIWRHAERVSHRVLDCLEADLLDAARAGASFGELCALAASARGNAQAPVLVSECLGRWVDAGMLVAGVARG